MSKKLCVLRSVALGEISNLSVPSLAIDRDGAPNRSSQLKDSPYHN